MNQRTSLVKNKVLSILPTRKCTSACKHCGTLSSPEATDCIPVEIVLNSIEQAAANGFILVAFTGGEATLEWDTLECGIKKAHELGLKTRIVTNAHWACTNDAAKRCIKNFREWGLDEINISTGDEHSRFVPQEYVFNGIVNAVEGGYIVHLMVEYASNRKITSETLLNNSLLLDFSKKNFLDIMESPWMPLSPNKLEHYANDKTVSKENVVGREGCSSVLQSYSIEPDRKVTACCGLGVQLIPELEVEYAEGSDFLRKAIKKSESDLLKLLLRYIGPEKLIAWASEKDPSIKWSGMYSHNCQACHRLYRDNGIRNIINDYASELLPDAMSSILIDEGMFFSKLDSKSYQNNCS